MFENLKSVQELNENKVPEENKTPASSPEENKDSVDPKTVSEDAKTPENKTEEIDDFHHHSRFKELVEEKNEWKNKFSEVEERYQSLESELNQMRSQIASSTGQSKGSIPSFETVEDLQNYLNELPKKIKEDVLNEFKTLRNSEMEAEREADDWLLGEIDALKEKDPNLNPQDLVKFALDYDLNDIPKAYELFKQIGQAKEEGKKSGEKIGIRKAFSGVKSSNSSLNEPKVIYRPGRSLDDIIEEAKQELRN